MKKLILAAVILAFTACNNGENHECQCAYPQSRVDSVKREYQQGRMSNHVYDSLVNANPCCF